MPEMSSASSITSRWCSDQNILFVAPSAATPRSRRPVSVAVSVRQPFTFMIWTRLQAFISRWRMVASSILPFALATSKRCSSSRSNRRYEVVADEPRSKPSVVFATSHPLFTPPTTFSLGQRALSKNTSLNSEEPSGCVIGRTSMRPGCFIGTRR